MVQRLCSYLVVLMLMLMFNGEIFGQISFKKFTQTSKRSALGSERFQRSFKKSSGLNYCVTIDCREGSLFPRKFTIKEFISKRYFDDQLGFFCKKELQFEKITSIRLRFRLGSVEYVNWMEGKPNAQKLW